MNVSSAADTSEQHPLNLTVLSMPVHLLIIITIHTNKSVTSPPNSGQHNSNICGPQHQSIINQKCDVRGNHHKSIIVNLPLGTKRKRIMGCGSYYIIINVINKRFKMDIICTVALVVL